MRTISEMGGRWMTFNEEGHITNHLFMDGCAKKSSRALCGKDVKNLHTSNLYGYVVNCPECERKAKELLIKELSTEPMSEGERAERTKHILRNR